MDKRNVGCLRGLRGWRGVALGLALLACAGAQRPAAPAAPKKVTYGDDLFVEHVIPHINIELSPEALQVLGSYSQTWGDPKPERVDVKATVREGDKVYTNVAIHIKGSGSFQPFSSKPSLTLNFDKFAPGQRFHGLQKIHLNNSVQDSSYLSEALAREMFIEAGVPAPRAGHAIVQINGGGGGLPTGRGIAPSRGVSLARGIPPPGGVPVPSALAEPAGRGGPLPNGGVIVLPDGRTAVIQPNGSVVFPPGSTNVVQPGGTIVLPRGTIVQSGAITAPQGGGGVVQPDVVRPPVQPGGRDLGLYVLVEGANKDFLKRYFDAVDGNFYDGDLGVDIRKPLKVITGDKPEDRSALEELVKACQETNLVKRAERIGKLLDTERFLTFAAMEILLGHWDGYVSSPNNFRVFHDTARNKIVFMPTGLDMLFGLGKGPIPTLTPQKKGLVAESYFKIRSESDRLTERMKTMATNEFRLETLTQRADAMAAKVRLGLAQEPQILMRFESTLQTLKARMGTRVDYIREHLANPDQPLQFGPDNTLRLTGWNFHNTSSTTGTRTAGAGSETLQVAARGAQASGSWRMIVLLGEGHYEFSANGHTSGMEGPPSQKDGVMLRKSGETSLEGLTATATSKTLSYEFDIVGIESVELVAEYRGTTGMGVFDASSFKLTRKAPLSKNPKPAQ